MNWLTHGLFYYLLPFLSLSILLLCYRDYGYSSLCIYLSLLLRRISGRLIQEARSAKDRQQRNAERIGRKLMQVDDEWFQMTRQIEGRER
jgi:hypothetical protein